MIMIHCPLKLLLSNCNRTLRNTLEKRFIYILHSFCLFFCENAEKNSLSYYEYRLLAYTHCVGKTIINVVYWNKTHCVGKTKYRLLE